MARFRVVDWFSSVGGFSSQAAPDHDVVGGVDRDVDALKCFQASFPEATTACRKLPATLQDCNMPTPHISTFWHFSPPCVAFSSARRACTDGEVDEAIKLLAWSIEMAVWHGVHYSIENVATEIPLAVATRYRDMHPYDVDFEVLCASSFGVPQCRKRLIISRPEVIQLLRDRMANPDLINMETAFARRGLPCPGTHVKNATTCKSGPCMRSIDNYCVTLVASRPVHFLRQPSSKWTAATEPELRTLMGLPDSLKLPSDKRGVVRALGNAVAGGVAKAILTAAKEVACNGNENFIRSADDQTVFDTAIAGAEECLRWYHKRESVKRQTEKRMPAGLSMAAEKRMRAAVVKEVMDATADS
jgi:site-specific DNA-cytosine methylase